MPEIIFITVLFTPEIIYILGGDKYATSITFLPGLTFATFIQSVTTIFTIILTYDKNVVKTAFFTGIFALVSIIAKWFLLSDGGLIVLIYVNIAVFVMLFFINYYLIKKAGYVNMLFLKGIISVIFLTGVLVVLSPLLYNHWQGFRYLITGFFLIIFITIFHFNKSRILKIVKNQ